MPISYPSLRAGWGICLFSLLLFSGCATVDKPALDLSKTRNATPKSEPLSRYGNPAMYEITGRRYYPLKSSLGFVERGVASWYGGYFHGRRTSSGETYDMYQMTAAHRILPLPTYVAVTNLENGRKVIVKVNDRGPFIDDRVIDLSYAAAQKLDIAWLGTARVEVRAIDPRRYHPEPPTLLAASSPAKVLAPPPRSRPMAQARPSPLKAANYQPTDRVYLQVGAFSDMAKAEKLRARLASQVGRMVRIHPTENPAKRLYRVQVGPLSRGEVPSGMVQTLMRMGLREHRLVMN
jgi:rare lipoprotein A